VGAPDCEKAELKYIYLLMKINGLKIASGWFNPPCFLVGPPGLEPGAKGLWVAWINKTLYKSIVYKPSTEV
jgi:hypothetical protein